MGTKYHEKIDPRKGLDPSNGYDILSYTLDGHPIHIEVKATTGKEDNFFYLTKHEYNTACRMKEDGLSYLIYFIKEVMSTNPKLEIIEDITANNGFEKKEEYNWLVTKVEQC